MTTDALPAQATHRRAKWFERFMLRLLSLAPGVYWITLVLDDEGAHWTVTPMGKTER